jgi:hypothetical protein
VGSVTVTLPPDAGSARDAVAVTVGMTAPLATAPIEPLNGKELTPALETVAVPLMVMLLIASGAVVPPLGWLKLTWIVPPAAAESGAVSVSAPAWVCGAIPVRLQV